MLIVFLRQSTPHQLLRRDLAPECLATCISPILNLTTNRTTRLMNTTNLKTIIWITPTIRASLYTMAVTTKSIISLQSPTPTFGPNSVVVTLTLVRWALLPRMFTHVPPFYSLQLCCYSSFSNPGPEPDFQLTYEHVQLPTTKPSAAHSHKSICTQSDHRRARTTSPWIQSTKLAWDTASSRIRPSYAMFIIIDDTQQTNPYFTADMYRGIFKFGVFNAVQSSCYDSVRDYLLQR